MTTEAISDMAQEALFLIIKTAMPVLLVSLIIGLAVSIFQKGATKTKQDILVRINRKYSRSYRENEKFIIPAHSRLLICINAAALADTFTLIPVNGAVFHGDRLVDAMLQFLEDYIGTKDPSGSPWTSPFPYPLLPPQNS